MNTLILLLLGIITLNVCANEPQAGTIKKSFLLGTKAFLHTNFTSSGYPILLEDKTGLAFVYDENGEVIKTFQVLPETIGTSIKWSLQDLDDENYLIQVEKKIDSKNTIIQHQVGSGSKSFSDAKQIGLSLDAGENKIALLGIKNQTDLRIVNESGKTIVAKELLENSWIEVTKSKDIIVTDEESVNLYDNNLNIKFSFSEKGKKFNMYNFLETKKGNLVFPTMHKELLILSITGSVLSRVQGDNIFKSVTNTPDGNIAALNGDGFLYLIDENGTVKHKHFHDSSLAMSVTACGDKLAYWNRTEIVFVDLKGNEVGSLNMPKIQKAGRLMPLPNNSLLAHENKDPEELYFIRCP